MPTAAVPGEPTPSESGSRISSASSFVPGGFAPGTVLGGRFRIFGLLGRGGMGEIYRADDLKLGQPVALKFLRKALSQDAFLLKRFHAEVRNARQVAHPNVCRMYDIGELDGEHFLSMEYVDGEDLTTLLKRIGRLPATKALEIARQMCAGLAAAHDKGVLHRDLKPSNVMLDGHGRVRITDFGLAVQNGAAAEGGLAGTPAYMAPEQIDGKAATVQSDLYSLGLILYEVFTGKPAFRAGSFAEWRRKHLMEPPTPPSSYAVDVDAAVERAILRCLEKEPAKRPASALQLAAALPGGDPLAAALAAGETPSPEMVAAADLEGALAPAQAWALLGGVVTCLALLVFVARYSNLLQFAPIEETPQVLAARARELIKKSGYMDLPADSADWFEPDNDYLTYRAEHLPSPQRVRELARAERHPVNFIYRQSPRPLAPTGVVARVLADDPPLSVSGMVRVILDGRGKLIEFRALGPEFDESKGPWPTPDWAALFAEAGLELDRFKRVEPRWLPPTPFDTQVAWDGSTKQAPDTALHVVAAAYRGKPVFFRVVGPWAKPSPPREPPPRPRDIAAGLSALLLFLSLLVGGLVFARRNLRLGRGDRKGAFRVASLGFCLSMLGWLLGSTHFSHPGLEGFSFIKAAAFTLFFAALVWLGYMALEPYVRRHSPHQLISWTRLLSGQFRDPLVGRDILMGALLGSVMAILRDGFFALPAWFDVPGLSPRAFSRSTLAGAPEAAAQLLGGLIFGLVFAVSVIFLLFLMRVILRKQWLAIAATMLLFAVAGIEHPGATQVTLGLAFARSAVLNGLIIFIAVRFGFLAVAAAGFILQTALNFPLTLDFSHWYANVSLSALLACFAVALYGFYTSLGGRPMFGSVPLDE